MCVCLCEYAYACTCEHALVFMLMSVCVLPPFQCLACKDRGLSVGELVNHSFTHSIWLNAQIKFFFPFFFFFFLNYTSQAASASLPCVK